MKLLVSPKNIQEAKVTIEAGVDYIDCKNPDEGSLGANFPWIIQEIKNLIPKNSKQQLSAAIGDFPNLPGTASLAALGAAASGADIIKIGLKGPKTIKQGINLLQKVTKAVENYNNKIKVVVAGYADYKRLDNVLDYLSLPEIAAESGADIVMLDTYIKDNKGLFDFLDSNKLSIFIKKANEYNLGTALAGNLRKEDIKKLQIISPDIIGIRSAVCEGFDRNNGKITLNKIIELKNELIRCSS
ncbi:MAG: (5-formylfuran-3-yl)methyl phosphate synthase [Candidatus Lokiarchaeota archaeon]|nr:(5-formylfuran-3-yl)methyl phosphate synthase [Candidatus Lokiarchaeota archaeon]